MIKQFEKLTASEAELLLKAPVLISVLASCSANEINKVRKADAIKLAHIKTFSAHSPLIPYYDAVYKNFKEEYEAAEKKYCPVNDENLALLRKEIDRVNAVMGKLDPEYADALHKSLEAYGKHVKRADHSFFQDFIFPLALPRILG